MRVNVQKLARLSVVALLVGCNFLTGADELTVRDGEELGGDDASGGAPGNGGGPGQGPGPGPGPGPGAGGSSGEGAGTPVGPEGDATGVSIQEVAFYQGVKSTVWANGGAQSPTVSIVAGRPAVVRVFASASGTSGAPITARLILGDNPPIEQQVSSFGSPSESSYGSTINFDVPGNLMASGSWRVEFVEPAESSSPNPGANTGTSSLQMQQSKPLKVTLIPVQYQADGSNRMPDVSQGQVDLYRSGFMSQYPSTDVIVEVGPTFAWGQTVSPGGGGWETLLNAITDERTSSNADFDEYYYGIFSPASSFNAYCSGGCVLGLGWIGDPSAEYTRAAIGIGYTGVDAVETAVHEVGHNHGRPHSPCGGASGVDPNYPHAGGDIGVWGMNIFNHEMVSPDEKDFMTYCHPQWISDYTFERILDFIGGTGAAIQYPAESLNQPYARVAIGEDSATFLNDITLPRPPLSTGSADVETITLTLADGSTKTVSGHFFRYDHLPGGVLYVKQQASPILALDAELDLAPVQDEHDGPAVVVAPKTLVQAVR